MNREIAGISFLFCLIVPVIATFTYLHYQKVMVRKEVKHQMIMGIEQADLVLLKFTKEESQANLSWKHSKEFEYQGQMYDIVKTETNSDTIYYWCWLDHAETKLSRKLDELITHVLGHSPQNQERQKKLLEFYKNLYCNSYTGLKEIFCQEANGKEVCFESLSSVYYAPLNPPPQLYYVNIGQVI